MTRVASIAGAAVLAALAAGTALAQEPSQSEMEAWVAAASPGEHHAVLEPLIGQWQHTVTFWMAPGAPPVEVSATSEAKWILDGRYVEQSWQGSFMGMPFRGLGITGYDNVRGEYVSIWMDNMSTGPMTGRGTFDPETRTLTIEGTAADPLTGEPDKPFRSVTRFEDDGSIVDQSYTPAPGGEMFQSMEIVSRKVE